MATEAAPAAFNVQGIRRRLNLKAVAAIERETLVCASLLGFAIAFNLYYLHPEVAINAHKLNDGVLHMMALRATVDAMRDGHDPTDFWFAPVTTGYPLFHHYQHLPFLPPAALFLALRESVGLTTIFNWTQYLLLSLFPLSIYWAMRRFGFPRITAALAGTVAPLISTNGLYGFDDVSYVWYGYGLYTQLWGMILLPPALACGYTAIRDGKGYFLAVLLLSVTVLSHLVLAYIGLSSLVLFALLMPPGPAFRTRLARLALVLGLTALVTSYFLVPFIRDGAYMNRGVWELQTKYDAFGYEWTLHALFGGRLFDYGRFPSLTLLLAAGVAICAWRWSDMRYRLPLLLGALWLALYFGRPTWGVLLNLLPLSQNMQFHRLIAGVHLAGIMIIGIALGVPWRWALGRRNVLWLLAVTAATALVLAPAYRDRREYLQTNEAGLQSSVSQYSREERDLSALESRLRALPPGRVYAGRGANWGNDYRVGGVPMNAILSSAGFDMTGYLYHSLSFNADQLILFDESRAEQYNLFNVRYVVAPTTRTFPDFVKPIGDFGRHRLYQIETSGYFDLVGSDVKFEGDKSEVFAAASYWLASGLPAKKEYPAITLEGGGGANTATLSSAPDVLSQMSIEAGASRGSIVNERIDGNIYSASVNVARPSMVMLKSTFHPGWHATIDGIPVKTLMLMPSYVAVPVRTGTHNIRFEYQPPKARLPLLLFGLALLPMIGLVEWRGRELRRFAVSRLPWLPGQAGLALEPPAAVSDTTVAVPPPARALRTLTVPSMAAWPATRILAAIVGLATLLRMAMTPLYAYLPDNSLDEYAWERWMQAIHQHGVLNIFRTTHTDYVGYHWVLWLLTAAYRHLGDDYRERSVHSGQYAALATPLHLLLKAPPIAFDAALIVVTYVAAGALVARLTARDPSTPDSSVASGGFGIAPALSTIWHGTAAEQRVALIAATFIAVQPAVVYESAVWAQIDAAIAAAMLLSVVLFALGRPGWGGAVWALGFAVKPHPVIILPVLAVLALRITGWRGALRAAGGAALVLAIILGPWILHGDAHRIYNTYKVLFQSDLYSGRLSSGAWNLWWFWDVHSHPLPHDAMFHFVPFFTYKRIGLGLSLSAGLIALTYAWLRPNLRGALIASAYLAFAFYMLPTSTHERYLFPFLALLLPIAVTERRWLWIYIPASATFALNLLVVAPPVHAWSGRWVESPFSLAVAATNVALFGAMTLIMIDGAMGNRGRSLAGWATAALGWIAPPVVNDTALPQARSAEEFASRPASRLARVIEIARPHEALFSAFVAVGTVLLIALLVGLPLLALRLVPGDDAHHHLPRITELYVGLRSGEIFPRWAPDLGSGYGQPTFNFYPPFFYYVAVFFHALGFGIVASDDLALFAFLITAGIGMYLLATEFLGGRAGLVSSAAYLANPWLVATLYERHAVGDFASFALMPLALWGVYRFIDRGQRRYGVIGGLAISMLILSTNNLTLIALPLLAIFVAWYAFWRKRPAVLIRGAACMLLSLGLTAFFWLPALVERGLIHLEWSGQDYHVYFRDFGWLVRWERDTGFPLGRFNLLMIAAGIAVTVGLTVLTRSRPVAVRWTRVWQSQLFFIGVIGGAMYFMDSRSLWFWDHLPLLSDIQFPWRFYTLMTFGGAFLCGLPLALFKGRRSWPASALTALLLVPLIYPGVTRANDYKTLPASTVDYSRSGIVAGRFEYTADKILVPKTVKQEPIGPAQSRLEFISGAGRVVSQDTSPNGGSFVVDVTDTARLRLNTFYFPGWTIRVDGHEPTVEHNDPLGVMEFTLAPGHHNVDAHFGSTRVRTLATALSLVTLVTLGIGLAFPLVPTLRRRPRKLLELQRRESQQDRSHVWRRFRLWPISWITLVFAGYIVVYIGLAIHSSYWLGIKTAHPIGDDFKIYYGAFHKALDGRNPYQPYGIGTGYVNHPAALSFVSLFAWGRSEMLSKYSWIAASGAAWLACIWFALVLAREAWSEQSISSTETIESWRPPLVATIFLGFAPMWETLQIGQVNSFALCFSLLSLYLAKRDRPVAAGITLAFAIVLKTSPIIFLAYFVVMQRFRVAMWTLIGVAAMSAVAALQFSPVVLEQFREILPKLGSEIHPFTYNQSILSVLHQAFPALRPQRVQNVLRNLHTIAFALITGGLLLAGLQQYRRTKQLSTWLFIAITTVSVFFSPLVWYHHSTFLLLPLAALLLSPHKAVVAIGLGSVLVLQAERLFEQSITLTAYPIVVIQIVLMAAISFLFLRPQGDAESGELYERKFPIGPLGA